MSDQEMFGGDEKSTTDENKQQNSGNPAESNTNPFSDKLEGIVNDKGEQKYKDLDSALEALKHSQEFIPQILEEKKTIEEQLNEMKQELDKRQSVEEAVEQLLGKNTQNHDGKVETKTNTSNLDEGKVQKMLEGMLDQRTKSEKEGANLVTVVSKLKDKYGEQAKEVIRARAKELGTTPTDLENIARQNPDMALTLLGGVELLSKAPSKATQTTPHTVPKDTLKPSGKKLINGGATKEELMGEWGAIKESVYKKHGVDS